MSDREDDRPEEVVETDDGAVIASGEDEADEIDAEEPADDELAEVLENEAELRDEADDDEPDEEPTDEDDSDAGDPGVGDDDGIETDALVSRLRLIGEQPLTERAASLGQLHDELRARLESGDPFRR